MKMNKLLAQEISNKVMQVIPYNVNIMDHIGLIIGSGDTERVGTFHEGAITAIEQGTIVSIFNTEGGAKPGVNIPIKFKNKVIGVIGISGDPNTVSPFAELVQITAELLINQEFLFKERRIKEQIKEEFLYQWVFRNDQYDKAFRNSAEAVGIDLNLERKAIIVKDSSIKEPYLSDQEFTFRLSQNTLLYIVQGNSDILKRLSGSNCMIGVGTNSTHIARSTQEAKRALEIAEKLSLSVNPCYYDDLKFIDCLTLSNGDGVFDEFSHCFQELESNPKGIELIETLISFIENNGDMNAISKKLHIHRNSLAYRLQKIEQLTNKNPKKFTDLFQLYTGYIQYKLKASD